MVVILEILFTIIVINVFFVYGLFLRFVGMLSNIVSTSNSLFQVVSLIPKALSSLQLVFITYFIESNLNSTKYSPLFFYFLLIFCNLIGLFLGVMTCNFFLRSTKLFVKRLDKKIANVWISKVTEYKFKTLNFDIRVIKIKLDSIFIISLFTTIINCISLPILIYLALYFPDFRSTIISTLPILFGIATVINIVWVETKLSFISDMIINKEMLISEYKEFIGNIGISKIIAIFLSLILFTLFVIYFM